MAWDDQFRPDPGRMSGKAGARRFLHRVLTASSLAAGDSPRCITGKRFIGSRVARGSGIGRVLAARGQADPSGQRRVIVKASIARLAGKGIHVSRVYQSYVERDGVSREGGHGRFYDATHGELDKSQFQERQLHDRHEFRVIVSPEDGVEYEDLKPLIRRLMARVELDLGTGTDWIAIDHFDTAHPHAHLIVRGQDLVGNDLVIAPDYLTHGLRERARELIELDLGITRDHAIGHRPRIAIDRDHSADLDPSLTETFSSMVIEASLASGPERDEMVGRLWHLEKPELAGKPPEVTRSGPDEPDMFAGFRNRELDAAGAEIARRLGATFMHPRPGDAVHGIIGETVTLECGRFMVLERTGEFSMVPWDAILEHRQGLHISGIMLGNGIRWNIGPERSL